jgi:hypothetical protein
MAGEGWRSCRFHDLIDAGTLEIGDGYRAKNAEIGDDGPLFLRAGHVAPHYSYSTSAVERRGGSSPRPVLRRETRITSPFPENARWAKSGKSCV